MSWSKGRILEEYLNRVDFGNLCRGAGAAVEHYFGKPVAQLSLAEKALEAAESRKSLVDKISLEAGAEGAVESMALEAPMTGQIRTTLVKPGAIVTAGAVLFEVMDDSKLWVKVPVYVGDLDDIDPALPIELTLLDGRAADTVVTARPIDLPPTATPLASAVDLYYELR